MDNDLSDIKKALIARSYDLACDLLGSPNKRLSNRREARWGQKGSLSLDLQGKKAGLWFDHELGQGGSLLDLIMREQRMSFADALRWARQWLGMPEGQRESSRASEPYEGGAEEKSPDEEEDARSSKARRLWGLSGPMVSTPAELYLSGRGIDLSTSGYPQSLRWHAPTGQLVAAVTGEDGVVRAVQRIGLTKDGKAKTDPSGRKLKLSLGPIKGGAVRFGSEGSSGPLIVAEGVETALSLWVATGYETWAVLGVVANVDLTDVALERSVVLCPDDDPRNGQTSKSLRAAILGWRQEGRKVVHATPFRTLLRDKADMNDAHQRNGAQYVRARVEAALAASDDLAGGTPQRPVGQSTDVLGQAFNSACSQVTRWRVK